MTVTVKYALVGAAALGAGYVLLRPKTASAASSLPSDALPPVEVKKAQKDPIALLRSVFGAKAASGSSSGMASVLTQAASGANAKISNLSGAAANKLIPGSGGFVKSVVSGGLGGIGSGISKGVSSLKFW